MLIVVVTQYSYDVDERGICVLLSLGSYGLVNDNLLLLNDNLFLVNDNLLC